MMIGLLTFQRADNYGAVLQAYALQDVIEKMNGECEYIDIGFNPKTNGTAQKTATASKLHKLKNIKKKISGKIRAQKFTQFRNTYINISKEKYANDSSITDNFKYDSYIVGSDQVWNFNITNSTLSFLLHFADAKKKKSSYASSFGVSELKEEHKEIFKNYLSRFDNISVRENQAKEIVNSLIEKEVEVCLDPTLLIHREQWSAMAKPPKTKKYVLIYAMADSEGLIKKAKEIAEKKKIKIIAIGLKENVKGIKIIRDASPLQWLGLIKNADTVITNSFHGTAFSINFNKDFYVEYLPDGWSVNSRLEDIVKMFGVEDFVLQNKNEDGLKSIDYNHINNILEEERKNSLKYLHSII